MTIILLTYHHKDGYKYRNWILITSLMNLEYYWQEYPYCRMPSPASESYHYWAPTCLLPYSLQFHYISLLFPLLRCLPQCYSWRMSCHLQNMISLHMMNSGYPRRLVSYPWVDGCVLILEDHWPVCSWELAPSWFPLVHHYLPLEFWKLSI